MPVVGLFPDGEDWRFKRPFPQVGREAGTSQPCNPSPGPCKGFQGSESPLINPGRRDFDKIEGRVFTHGPLILGGSVWCGGQRASFGKWRKSC